MSAKRKEALLGLRDVKSYSRGQGKSRLERATFYSMVSIEKIRSVLGYAFEEFDDTADEYENRDKRITDAEEKEVIDIIVKHGAVIDPDKPE